MLTTVTRSVTALANGEDRAPIVALLYEKQARLLAIGRSRGSASPWSDEEDLFQDLMKELCDPENTMPVFESRKHFTAYIITRLKNLSIDRYRKRRSEIRRVELYRVVQQSLEPADMAYLKDLCDTAREAMLGLPAADREFLELSHGRQKSLRQIAAAKGVTLHAVRADLGRVRGVVAAKIAVTPAIVADLLDYLYLAGLVA